MLSIIMSLCMFLLLLLLSNRSIQTTVNIAGFTPCYILRDDCSMTYIQQNQIAYRVLKGVLALSLIPRPLTDFSKSVR